MLKKTMLTIVLVPFAVGCSRDPGSTNSSPITGLQANKWTWVPFADAKCRDGSSTGIAVNPSPGSDKVVIFLMGGGACFNATTCAGNPASFSATDFAGLDVPACGSSASSGTQELNGFAQIPLRSAGAPINHNPSLSGLLVNGVWLPADGTGVLARGVKVRLQPVPASGAKEDTGNGLEALNFSFFATDGDVASLRSTDQTATGELVDPSIDYTAPMSAGPVQLWVVVRDGRGGVGWISRSARVQ